MTTQTGVWRLGVPPFKVGTKIKLEDGLERDAGFDPSTGGWQLFTRDGRDGTEDQGPD